MNVEWGKVNDGKCKTTMLKCPSYFRSDLNCYYNNFTWGKLELFHISDLNNGSAHDVKCDGNNKSPNEWGFFNKVVFRKAFQFTYGLLLFMISFCVNHRIPVCASHNNCFQTCMGNHQHKFRIPERGIPQGSWGCAMDPGSPKPSPHASSDQGNEWVAFHVASGDLIELQCQQGVARSYGWVLRVHPGAG